MEQIAFSVSASHEILITTKKNNTMIYKLTFDDGRIDWCTAKNELHLLKSYDADFDLPLQEIEDLQSITDEEAKTIMVKNTEFYEDNPNDMSEQISLYDLSVDEDFAIIA